MIDVEFWILDVGWGSEMSNFWILDVELKGWSGFERAEESYSGYVF